jgi:hypothetical protein
MYDYGEKWGKVGKLAELNFVEETLLKSDKYFGDGTYEVRTVKESVSKTGYPFNLSESQVVRLIYFFGARKLAGRALTGGRPKVTEFNSTDLKALHVLFDWFGYGKPKEMDERRKSYQMCVINFKNMLVFLKTRPAFVTRYIYNALKICGYENALRNIIVVVDKSGKITTRLVAEQHKKNIVPIAQADKLLWEIQNVSLDKMMMVLQSITYKDVLKANLGMKSKALRDIFSMYHMSKLNNKNPNMTLVNVNVNSADPQEKMNALSAYVIKNRES